MANEWTNLTLSSSTLEGIAPVDLTDPETGQFDEGRATTAYISQAKRYIQMRLMKVLPHMISDADGPTEWLDAAIVINKGYINDGLQNLLAHAFLMHYYEQESTNIGSMFAERAALHKMRFDETLEGFVNVIRQDDDFIDQAESTTTEDLHKHGVPVYIG